MDGSEEFYQGISTIWHDARAPLTAALGYTDLLLEGEGGKLTEEQYKLLEIVRKGCRCAIEFWEHAADYIHQEDRRAAETGPRQWRN